MDDSLILDPSDTSKRDNVRKQTSSIFPDSPSFLAKRCRFETPINDTINTIELSEFNPPNPSHFPTRTPPHFIESSHIEQQSSLHLSGQRAAKPPQEISFQSISLQENDPSIIRDVVPAVNFDGISLSGINESSISETRLSAAGADSAVPNEEVNPADLSYEALLRWEQQQGGVLDERWNEMREATMRVAMNGRIDVDRNWSISHSAKSGSIRAMRRTERAAFARVSTMWRRTTRPIRSVCFPARISFIKVYEWKADHV